MITKINFLKLVLFYNLTVINLIQSLVVPLESKDLEKFNQSHNETVIYFYVNWCQACKQFDPIYHTVANEYRKIAFAKVDATLDRGAVEYFTKDEFPALVLFRNSTYVDRQRGKKTKSNLIYWIKLLTGDAIEWLDSAADARNKSQEYKISFIGRFPLERQAAVESIYERIASQHRPWGKFFALREHTVMSPRVEVKHPQEEMQIYNLTFDSSELVQWLSKARFPLFGEITQENQHDYYSAHRDPVIFLGTKQDIEDHGSNIRLMAKTYNDTHSFMWTTLESSIGETLRDLLEPTQFPALITFTGTGNLREHKRYIYPYNATFDATTAISNFLNQIKNHSLRPVVMSERGMTNEELKVQLVKRVTGNRFESIVLQEKKDFIMVLVAPSEPNIMFGCAECDKAISALHSLASHVKRTFNATLLSDMVDFGQFDVTKNEIPLHGWGGSWTFDELPVMYLVPAGSRRPYEYKGKITPETITHFWQIHTLNPLIKTMKNFNTLYNDRLSTQKKEEL